MFFRHWRGFDLTEEENGLSESPGTGGLGCAGGLGMSDSPARRRAFEEGRVEVPGESGPAADKGQTVAGRADQLRPCL